MPRLTRSIRVPELAIHAATFLLFVIEPNIFELVVCLPLLAVLGYRLATGRSRYDPLTVFYDIKDRERACYVRLAFYLLHIFGLLFQLLYFVIVTFALKG